MADSNETREFRVADGFDLARLLDERDQYHKLANQLNLSTLLDFPIRTDGITARFRLPNGVPLEPCVELGEDLTHELLRLLIAFESRVADAPACLAPKDTYLDAESSTITFHAALIGWHKSSAAVTRAENLASWLEVLTDWTGDSVGVVFDDLRSFSELRGQLIADGVIGELELDQDLLERVELLRRRACKQLESEPAAAIETLNRALAMRFERDLVLHGLEACVRAGRPGSFDRLAHLALAKGVDIDEVPDALAFRAWRKHQQGDWSGAMDLLGQALKAHVCSHLALELKAHLQCEVSDIEGASETYVSLVAEHGNLQTLRNGLGLAWKAERLDLAEKMFDGYSLPITDAICLLLKAEVELSNNQGERVMSTLMTLTQSAERVEEDQVGRVLSLAESACRRLAPGEQIEKILHLLEALFTRIPHSEEVVTVYFEYLLAGNLHDRCHQLADQLPDNARARHGMAILHFREGRMRESIELGLRALREGCRAPDLVTTLAEACLQQADSSSFAELQAVAGKVADEYPGVREKMQQTRNGFGYA